MAVEETIAALPHDAHPMGTILTGLCALSTLHPEQVRAAAAGVGEAQGYARTVRAYECASPCKLASLACLRPCLPVCPPQNPALAGQNIYQSKEVQDKQIVRLIGKIPTLAALAYHRASGRKPAQPNQNLGYTEVGGGAAGRGDMGAGGGLRVGGQRSHRPCLWRRPAHPRCPAPLCPPTQPLTLTIYPHKAELPVHAGRGWAPRVPP